MWLHFPPPLPIFQVQACVCLLCTCLTIYCPQKYLIPIVIHHLKAKEETAISILQSLWNLWVDLLPTVAESAWCGYCCGVFGFTSFVSHHQWSINVRNHLSSNCSVSQDWSKAEVFVQSVWSWERLKCFSILYMEGESVVLEYDSYLNITIVNKLHTYSSSASAFPFKGSRVRVQISSQ